MHLNTSSERLTGFLGCKHAEGVLQMVHYCPGHIVLVATYLYQQEGKVKFEQYLQPPTDIASAIGSVTQTISETLQRTLLKLSSEAKELLQACAVLDNTRIPQDLLKGGIGIVPWMKGICDPG